MRSESVLTITAIRALFTEEVTAAGGRVTDVFEDDTRLFARSVLPWSRTVQPQDQLDGGVAVRAAGVCVWVHPYVFRQVCSNGAIMARSMHSQQVGGLDELTADEAEATVREAVRACCVEDALATFADEARTAMDVEADLTLQLMSLIARTRDDRIRDAMLEIVDRFIRDRDSSKFGLMNAVTSVARDTQDPELRWRLEELGGGISSPQDPVPPPLPGVAKRYRPMFEHVS